MGATTVKTGKSFDDLLTQFREYLTGLSWAYTVNDVVLLNPITKECRIYKVMIGEHNEFIGFEDAKATRFPHSASVAGIYGPKPGPGELVGWCYFDI